MAERYGSLLRRWLRSAERFRDRAIAFGLSSLKTLCLRSNASLVAVTRPDHLRSGRFALLGADRVLCGLLVGALRVVVCVVADLRVVLAMLDLLRTSFARSA